MIAQISLSTDITEQIISRTTAKQDESIKNYVDSVGKQRQYLKKMLEAINRLASGLPINRIRQTVATTSNSNEESLLGNQKVENEKDFNFSHEHT